MLSGREGLPYPLLGHEPGDAVPGGEVGALLKGADVNTPGLLVAQQRVRGGEGAKVLGVGEDDDGPGGPEYGGEVQDERDDGVVFAGFDDHGDFVGGAYVGGDEAVVHVCCVGRGVGEAIVVIADIVGERSRMGDER